MKPVVTRLYAVLVFLAIVGLSAWAGADWYQRQQRAADQGRVTLRQAAGLISDLSLRAKELSPQALAAVFASTSSPDPRWKMVLLYSPQQGTLYYRGPRPSASPAQTVPQWDARPWAEVKTVLSVFQTGRETLTLEGIYEFYGRAEIFSLLKAAGLTLVVLLILTTVLVLIAALTQGAEPEPRAEPHQRPRPTPPPSGSSPRSRSDADRFADGLDLEDLPPLETAPGRSATPQPEVPRKDANPSLVSPQSGLGWESFLTPRLAGELERCTSQNQDLAVVLLTVKTGTVAPGLWGAAIHQAFPSKDLNFEHSSGAAIVMPGTTLEQALKAARAFLELADGRFAGAVVHAGVAARSGRLLSAATLLAEADSARRRSVAGTVRVLGLKTDPDRYRDYLASVSA